MSSALSGFHGQLHLITFCRGLVKSSQNALVFRTIGFTLELISEGRSGALSVNSARLLTVTSLKNTVLNVAIDTVQHANLPTRGDGISDLVQ